MENKLYLLFCLFCASFCLNAQSPLAFKYQAVARDVSGQVYANQPVSLQFLFHEDDENGPVIYAEALQTQTGDFGKFAHDLGAGGPVSGLPHNFASLDWANHQYFLRVKLIVGGSEEVIGVSQLLSVPYALYALQAGQTAGDGDVDPANEIQQISINGNAITLSPGGGTINLPPPPAYTGGTAIQVNGTVINNTGDTNPADDLTTSSTAGGDLSGAFANLQIIPGAVGTGELADGAVGGAKIAQQGASGGQVLKWNGASWAPANDNGDTYSAGNGIAIAGNVVSNTGDTNPADDLTTSSTAGGDLSGAFANLQINAGAVGTGELADGAVGGAKIAQQGATGGQVLKWNGTSWGPQDDGFSGTLGGDVDGPPGSNEIKSLRGRPLGGMPPTGANAGFAYIFDGAEWQLDTLHGDLRGTFNAAEVKALRGRPIGGMPPTGANAGYAYIFDGAEWQLDTPKGDLQGTFNDVEVKGLRGRPIGGMPPTGASTALIHIPDPDDPDNAGSFEYSDPNGDITVDGAQRLRVSKIQDLAVDFSMGIGDGMVLTCVDNGGGLQFECRMPTGGFSVPYSNTPASYGSTLFSLTNTNSTTSQTIFPVKGSTANQYNLWDFGNTGQASATLSLKSFYYPAGVYGENTNTNPNAAGAGVLGRAIVSANNRGVGGWFQGNSVGTLSQCFQSGLAAFAGYSQGSRYGAYLKLVNAPSGGTNYAALYAETTNTATAWAGYFVGDVNVTGTVFKPAANFRIDHPEDPENKYLVHASVESPEMKTLYDGIATTDAQGYATVVLPPYFEDLNGDVRYQLTVIGDFAQAIVSQKVKDGKFVIRTDKPSVEVSWQLSGVRRDPYAKAHPTVPEMEKPAAEKGTYLHPELYNQPASRLLGYRSTEIEE